MSDRPLLKAEMGMSGVDEGEGRGRLVETEVRCSNRRLVMGGLEGELGGLRFIILGMSRWKVQRGAPRRY